MVIYKNDSIVTYTIQLAAACHTMHSGWRELTISAKITGVNKHVEEKWIV